MCVFVSVRETEKARDEDQEWVWESEERKRGDAKGKMSEIKIERRDNERVVALGCVCVRVLQWKWIE